GTVRTVDDPLHGSVDIPGMPIKWKDHPSNITLTAPTLGQHNEEVLTERLGKSAAQIEELRRAGVLFEKEV
ncbi:MAG: CoA transferase, partial [Myxococcales bacterium]|nr:CoA transferase [Myxococcales bacterium]